jgi:hypothetical protein
MGITKFPYQIPITTKNPNPMTIQMGHDQRNHRLFLYHYIIIIIIMGFRTTLAPDPNSFSFLFIGISRPLHSYCSMREEVEKKKKVI